MRDGSPNAAIAPGATPATPVVGNYDAAKFPAYTNSTDGFPATTDIDNKMLIGYGANADRYETWLSNSKPTQDSQQPFVKAGTNNPYPALSAYPANPSVRNSSTGFFITGQVPGDQAVHTATDIPLSAYGLGAALFTGVMDNTDVFFKLAQASLAGVPASTANTVKQNPTSQEECVFKWAEGSTQYGKFFQPAGPATQIAAPFTYRYYSTSKTYLGVSSDNNHVIFVGTDGVQQDVGALSTWLTTAGCK
jgi:hypothetical protein